MIWFRQVWSSIVFKVTALTVVGLMLMLAGVLLLIQTLLLTTLIYPRTLSDNAGSIAELVWLLESSPEAIDPFILSVYDSGFRTAVISGAFTEGLEPNGDMQARLVNGESDVAARLEGSDIRFETLGTFQVRARMRQEGANPKRVLFALQVAIELRDGRVLNVWLAPALTFSRQPAALFAVGLVIVSLSIALGLAIAAVTLRPIRQLEQDAARVELGEAGAAISETGPIELRRLSAALNRMRGRLTGLIREREQMVAAIAHDIRTGLTRIRLRMDEHGAVSASEIECDVAQMEMLISDMVAYARAESPSGPQELIRLEAFVADVVEAAPHAIELNLPEGDDFMFVGDPIALRRLFENLIENSRRYGGGEIAMRVIASDAGRDVCVEDNGPGLPEGQLETVFQPFQRGEHSRNRTTGGSGLGLGIARAIARAHGASLRLENRPKGGLAAIIHFPEALRT